MSTLEAKAHIFGLVSLIVLGSFLGGISSAGVAAYAVPVSSFSVDLGQHTGLSDTRPSWRTAQNYLGETKEDARDLTNDESDATQIPLDERIELERTKKATGLHGKFLHITDIVRLCYHPRKQCRLPDDVYQPKLPLGIHTTNSIPIDSTKSRRQSLQDATTQTPDHHAQIVRNRGEQHTRLYTFLMMRPRTDAVLLLTVQ